MYKYLLLVWFLACFALKAAAQQPDTSTIVKTQKDTLVSTKQDSIAASMFRPKVKKEKERVYHPDTTHSPHKAIMRSLMIPGWGQLYNHRWWKVPVIYGGLGLLGVAIIFNASNYNEFIALAHYREKGIVPTPTMPYYAEYNLYANQTSQAIYDASDGYHRYRDLCILGLLGAWGINVIDAYIDAKFQHSYSVDSNLSFKVTPSLLNQPTYALVPVNALIPGLKFTFTF